MGSISYVVCICHWMDLPTGTCCRWFTSCKQNMDIPVCCEEKPSHPGGSSKMKSLPKAPISLGPVPSTGLWKKSSIYLRYVVGNDQLLRKVYKGQGWNNWAASGRGCVVHCLHLFLLSGKTRAESTIPAPLKIHIEPENHPIKKENNRPNLHFWVPPSEATKLCSWPYRNIWLDKWNSRYFNKGFLAYYRVGWGLCVFRIIMTVWNFIDV